jgi:hypothetical protein
VSENLEKAAEIVRIQIQNARLHAEIARLRQALEVFADPVNWEWEIIDNDSQARTWVWDGLRICPGGELVTIANPVRFARRALDGPEPDVKARIDGLEAMKDEPADRTA